MKVNFDGMEMNVDGPPTGDPERPGDRATALRPNESDFPAAGSQRDLLLFLLRYAVLAPSTHNTQPWRFNITPEGIEVYGDYRRRLPVVDPGNRELLMSVGGAIFNLRVAASHFRLPCSVEYNLSGDSERPLVVVRVGQWDPHLRPDPVFELLFPSIVERHTNRNPFLLSRVATSVLHRLSLCSDGTNASLVISTDGAMNEKIGEMVVDASIHQWSDAEFRKDIAEWIAGDATVRWDGIPAAAYGWTGPIASLGSYAAKTIDQGRLRAARDRNLCVEAPGLIVIAGEDATQYWLQTGEVHQRLCLTIVREGLQYSYFNMPVQIPELRAQLKAILGCQQWPQLILRVGYCLTPPTPTPRRPIEDVMM